MSYTSVCPWGVRYGVGWYVGVEWVDIQVWSGLVCVGVHRVRCSVCVVDEYRWV